MPDFWSHIVAGDILINSLNDRNLSEKIRQNRLLFNFACQGPDFFYYHGVWPWSKEKLGSTLGNLIHQKNSNKLIINSLNFLKKNYNLKLDIYLTGLFLHYFIDRTTHPLIFNIEQRGYEHKTIEINLDLYIAKKFYHQQAFKLSPRQRINLAKIPEKIQKYYLYLFKVIYNKKNLKPKIINESFADFKKILTLFYSPLKIKSSCFKLLNFLFPVNLAKVIYPNKINYNMITTDEYQQIYNLIKQGVSETIDFLNLKNNYLSYDLNDNSIKEKINNINFNGQTIK